MSSYESCLGYWNCWLNDIDARYWDVRNDRFRARFSASGHGSERRWTIAAQPFSEDARSVFMCLPIVRELIKTPRLSDSSSAIRSSLQLGFSRAMVRMSACKFLGSGGFPGL